VLLQLAILLSMGVFVSYFLRIALDPKLVPGAAARLSAAHGVLRGLLRVYGLMVTLFNLPTAAYSSRSGRKS
jgi:hypothetical protein